MKTDIIIYSHSLDKFIVFSGINSKNLKCSNCIFYCNRCLPCTTTECRSILKNIGINDTHILDTLVRYYIPTKIHMKNLIISSYVKYKTYENKICKK